MTPHMTLNCTIDYKLTKISIIVEIDREINKRLKKVESCAHLHYLRVCIFMYFSEAIKFKYPYILIYITFFLLNTVSIFPLNT